MNTVAASSPVERLLARLDAVKPTGEGRWQARCPCHNDTKPSLSIAVGQDGKILLHCHGGCATERVLEAVGLEWCDLFSLSGRKAGQSRGKQVVSRKEYPLHDANGELVAVHIRFDFNDGSKRFAWRRNGKPNLGGLSTASLPLYRIGDVLAAPPGEAVTVCEGGKAADALAARGVLAVGTVTGASGTPSDDTLRPLLGRPILLWADADESGRRHMLRIGKRLKALGATDVRWVTWPDAPLKGDAADFVERDDGEALHRLLAEARPFNEIEAEGGDGSGGGADASVVRRLRDDDGSLDSLIRACEMSAGEARRKAIFRAVSLALGVEVTRWRQFGRDPATATFVLTVRRDGREIDVSIGGVAAILSQRRFRSAIFVATQILPRAIGRREWDVVVAGLGLAGEVIEDAESSEVGLLREALHSYLQARPLLAGDDLDDQSYLIRAHHPWLDESGTIWISLSDFRVWSAVTLGYHWSPQTLSRLLRQCGWFPRRVTFTQEDRDGQSRRVWMRCWGCPRARIEADDER